MKKLLGILVLGLLWCNVGLAEKFIITCSGTSKTIGLFGTTSDSFYEDLTVIYYDEKIQAIFIDGTNHNLSRSGLYTLEKGNLEVFGSNIKMKDGYKSIGEDTIKEYSGSMSLTSGRLNGFWQGSGGDFNWTITWDAKCQGAKKLYAHINKIDEETKGIDDNAILAASSGTGFFVSNSGHMITNYHVVEMCKPIKAIYDGKEFEAQVLAVDKINDLAIIKSNVRPKKMYSVAIEDAQLLENVIIAGYPLGKKVSASIKATSGTITGLSGVGDNYAEFQTDAALNSGNSGGPIIDENGNVIGVAVSKLQGEGVEGFNFGVKSSVLRIFANANELKFLSPNRRPMKKKDLGKLVTQGTVYLECWMKGKDLKKLITRKNSRKAFFRNY